MSYRRNNTSAAAAATTTTAYATRHRSPPAGQRSYIVSIDTGPFANVEIVVGDYHHRTRAGMWTSSRAADNVKVVTSKSHVYAYAPTSPSTPITKQRTLFTPLQQQQQPASSARSHSSSSTSTSTSDAWSKRSAYERERGDRARDYDYIAARQHRLADERARAHHRREREREEEARQLAEAEARRAAAVAKEARRRQRLAEQQRHEEQKRQQEQQRALREDRRRLERTRRARAHEIANAWSSYETRWGLLNQSQNQRQLGGASLTFERIPWPITDSEVIIPPPLDGRRTRTTRAPLDELLRPEAIREFLLSPAHSPEVSSKDRIRAALRRWHPDKFARLLGLVVERDRDAVADGVGIVVRCLNEMLERENHA